MRTAIVMVACAATLSTAGLAQTAPGGAASPGPHGDYDVFGVGPDGSQYAGSLTIAPLVDDFSRFDWAVGTAYSGVGRQIEGGFVTLWSPAGVSCSLRALRLTETGMVGQWLSSTLAGLGEEEALAPEGADGGLVGNYALRGTGPDGAAYEGTLLVADAGEGSYRFTWQIGERSYTGTGALTDGAVGLLVSDAVGSCGLSQFATDGFGNLSSSWTTNAPEAGNGFEWAYRQGTGFEFGGERYYPTWTSPEGGLTEYHLPGEPVESWTHMVQVNRTGIASPYQFIATSRRSSSATFRCSTSSARTARSATRRHPSRTPRRSSSRCHSTRPTVRSRSSSSSGPWQPPTGRRW